MFQEVKAMLPISGDDYDQEIIMQIYACALDLTTSAEITLPGTIVISRDAATGVVADTSTLIDQLIITAIGIWCNMRIGNPPNYDNLLKAYESLKGQMRLSKSYTASEPAEGDDGE